MDRDRAPYGARSRPGWRVGAVLAGILVMLATSPVAPPLAEAADPRRATGILGDDDRVILDPTAWPWIALGRVNRETGGFCTGALVAPNLVLTAAHCVYDARSGRLLRPASLHFLAGYRRGEFRGHARAIEIIRPDAPALDSGHGIAVVAADWAILVLAAALSPRPLPVRALASGERPGTGDDGRLLRAGYGRDRPHLLSLHDGCAIVDRAAGGAVLIHTCDAMQGESGSPLLIRDGDGFAVFGINSGVARVGGRSRGIAVHAAAFLPTLTTVAAAHQSREPHAPASEQSVPPAQ